jgi:hypothetical protein
MLRRNSSTSSSVTQLPPQPQGTTPVPATPRTLTHAQMNAAIEQGLATSPLIRQDVLRYDGAWWQATPRGWLEHIDSQLIATLDHRAASMTGQQEIALRNANIRAAADSGSAT